MKNLYLAFLVALRLRLSRRDLVMMAGLILIPLSLGLFVSYAAAQHPTFGQYFPMARYMPKVKNESRVFERTTLCVTKEATPFVKSWLATTKATIVTTDVSPFTEPKANPHNCLGFLSFVPAKPLTPSSMTTQVLPMDAPPAKGSPPTTHQINQHNPANAERTPKKASPSKNDNKENPNARKPVTMGASPSLTLMPPQSKVVLQVQSASPSAAEWISYRIFKEQNKHLEQKAKELTSSLPMHLRVPISKESAKEKEQEETKLKNSVISVLSSVVLVMMLLELAALSSMFSSMRIEQWRHMGTLEAFSLAPRPMWVLFVGQALHVGFSLTIMVLAMMLGLSFLMGISLWLVAAYIMGLMWAMTLCITALVCFQVVLFPLRWWPVGRMLVFPVSALIPWVVYGILFHDASLREGNLVAHIESLSPWLVGSVMACLLLFATVVWWVVEHMLGKRRHGLSTGQS